MENSFEITSRISALRSKVKVPVALFGEGGSFRYFTGLDWLSGILLITNDNVFVFSADKDLASKTGFNAIRPERKTRALHSLLKVAKEQHIKSLGVDFSSISFDLAQKLQKSFKLIDVSGTLCGLRERKSKRELDNINSACKLAEKAMSSAAMALKEGATEREVRKAAVASVLDKCEDLAFSFIVASGENSMFTHTYPKDKCIKASDLVIIDLGLRVNGYCSDMTRTFCLKPNDQQKRLHTTVLHAQDLAFNMLKPGLSCSKLAGAVEKFFISKGVRDYWKYGLGHGVGLDVHEPPRLSIDSKDKLKEGTAFTIEPGLHIPGIGGARIEDTVLLLKKPEKLTRFPYDLVL